MHLVEVIGNYFATPLRPENAQEHRLATRIVRDLLREASLEVRRRVAEKLAWQPGAPMELIVELAHDEDQVARPLLIESAALGDAELLEIAQQRSMRHRLAIAMRREVSEAICRTLIDLGDLDVASALLENPGARIPRDCLDGLVERSREEERLHEPLVHRRDLPPVLAARLIGWVSDALRRDILRHFPIAPEMVDDAIRDVVLALKREMQAPQPASFAQIAEAVAAQRGDDPGSLLALLRSGNVALFEAMFAQMTDLPTHVARRVIYETGGRPLAVACRAIGAQKVQYAGILLLVRQARPGEQAIEPSEMQASMAFFDSVDHGEAMRILQELRAPGGRTGGRGLAGGRDASAA
jgi:uncharacterized protein (DUF2336 family)